MKTYLIKLQVPIITEVNLINTTPKEISKLKKNFKMKGSKLLITKLS